VDAADQLGQPLGVEIKETALRDAPKTVSVAPISVSIYQFPATQVQ
jgi:hypothetical protein